MSYNERKNFLKYLIKKHMTKNPFVGMGPAYLEGYSYYAAQKAGKQQAKNGLLLEDLFEQCLQSCGAQWEKSVARYPDLEVDFIVNKTMNFHCKTSIRERWAQPDRTEIVLRHLFNLNCDVSILLLGCEKPKLAKGKGSPVGMAEFCRDTEAKCRGLHKVISVLVPEHMLALQSLLVTCNDA